MDAPLATLIDRLDNPTAAEADVIKWGSPVPSFGDLTRSHVATLGLNPSNREFVDENGNELQGTGRRFQTLNSLGLQSWADADARHLNLIIDSCRNYFLGNPYDVWFKKLDQLVSATGHSFYSIDSAACHLDLIPYATATKWMNLSVWQRTLLVKMSADSLGLLLASSPVQLLLLNGRSVVEHFEEISGTKLSRLDMPDWRLHRRTATDVPGVAFVGRVSELGGVLLDREITVLGYNHNLQSSFGVTRRAVDAIREWISEEALGALA